MDIPKEITLKEWSAYLPYGLKVKLESELYPTPTIIGITNDYLYLNYHGYRLSKLTKDCKPILRDLSDLTKEIEHNGERFIPEDRLYELADVDAETEFLDAIFDGWWSGDDKIQFAPYTFFQKMVEWKFNFFQIPDELIVKVTEDFNPYK